MRSGEQPTALLNTQKSMHEPHGPYGPSGDRERFARKFFGGDVERVPPDPIPNSEVKTLRADGTARATWWESRTPPELF